MLYLDAAGQPPPERPARDAVALQAGDVQLRIGAGFGEAIAVAGHPVRQRGGVDADLGVAPFIKRFDRMKLQLEAQPALAHLQSVADPALDALRRDDRKARLAPAHAGAGQQAGQPVAVVAVHMGDADRPQVVQRQRGAQQPMLRALAAIDQIPALAPVVLQRQAADIARAGGRARGGAEK